MSWETRGEASYFYAARRHDGGVVKDYFGRGPAAEVAAELAGEAARRRAGVQGRGGRGQACTARQCRPRGGVRPGRRVPGLVGGGAGRRRLSPAQWRALERRRRSAAPRRGAATNRGSGLRDVPYVEPSEALRVAGGLAPGLRAAGEPALAEALLLGDRLPVREAIVGPEDPPVLKLLAANAASTWLESQCANVAEAEAREGVSLRRATSARAWARAARDRHARSLRELGTARRLLEAHDHSPRIAEGTAARRPLPLIRGGPG